MYKKIEATQACVCVYVCLCHQFIGANKWYHLASSVNEHKMCNYSYDVIHWKWGDVTGHGGRVNGKEFCFQFDE